MRSWEDNKGVVDTIYEEEHECCSSSSSSSPSPSLCPSLYSAPTPLHSRVESWSLARRKETDVLIYVRGTCFRLHKDPLTSKSGYLKRQLRELSEIVLPLNITAETFTLVADFCYVGHVVITPLNVASLRTAAELLEMTTETNSENLKQMTERYFRQLVAVNSELALMVFRSCLRLLPEAETAGMLVSRCVQSLDLMRGGEEELDVCVEQIISLPAQEFMVVAEAFQCRFGCHDFLYRIVDLYLKEHSFKITEEQKAEICNVIDSEKLSPRVLIHAMQNPRLSLRFLLRGMMIEQLNTRRTISTANIITASTDHRTSTRSHGASDFTTLGSILQRDAAARDAAKIKSEMDDTSARIAGLEKELAGMKKLLQKSEKQIRKLTEREKVNEREKEKTLSQKFDDPKLFLETEHHKQKSLMESIPEEMLEGREGRSVMQSSRSSSFHYGLRDAEIKRGERGSVSFSSSRFGFGSRERRNSNALGCSFPSPSCDGTPRTRKSVGGKGLISRLKSTFFI